MIKGVVFDLDGTIYLGEKLLPGAAQTVEVLRGKGLGVAFLSNNPLKTRQEYAEKLTRLGIAASIQDVIHSSTSLILHLLRSHAQAPVMVLGEMALKGELQAAGFVLTEDPQKAQVVVASFDRTFDYRKLDLGYRALKAGAYFVATNSDRTCPVPGGEIPDAAAVIGALEGCSGRKVQYVAGKPNPDLLRLALERLDSQASECMMVGDRLETDMRMGVETGMVTAMVLTGVTSKEEAENSPFRPDHIVSGVGDILSLLSQ